MMSIGQWEFKTGDNVISSPCTLLGCSIQSSNIWFWSIWLDSFNWTNLVIEANFIQLTCDVAIWLSHGIRDCWSAMHAPTQSAEFIEKNEELHGCSCYWHITCMWQSNSAMGPTFSLTFLQILLSGSDVHSHISKCESHGWVGSPCHMPTWLDWLQRLDWFYRKIRRTKLAKIKVQGPNWALKKSMATTFDIAP